MSFFGKRFSKLIVYSCSLLLALFFISPDSYGEQKTYPNRTIKMIVGPVGGVPDLWARAWLDEFSKTLKVPVVIANVAGASLMGALIEAASAKPDGYTIATASQSNVVGYSIAARPVVDLFKDFVPLGAFGSFPTVVAVEAGSPIKTYEDLIDFAKKNPKKLKCGTAGATIISTFIFELLKQHTNIDIVMVPFKGSPPAVNALLGKHVDLLTLSPSALMGLIKAGRVRVLLTTRKMKEIPEVPSFADKGLADAALPSWSGIVAPAAITPEIRKKLVDTFAQVVKDPKVVKRIEDLGFNTYYQSPQDLTIQMKKDSEKLSAVAKQAGISE